VQNFQAIHPNVSGGCTYVLRGIANFRRGYYLASEMDFTHSLKRVGPEPFTYYNRAITRGQLSDIEGAIKDLSAAIALRPSEASFYIQRALMHRRRGDFPAAEKDYTTAALLNPPPDASPSPVLMMRTGKELDVDVVLRVSKEERTTLQLECLCW